MWGSFGFFYFRQWLKDGQFSISSDYYQKSQSNTSRFDDAARANSPSSVPVTQRVASDDFLRVSSREQVHAVFWNLMNVDDKKTMVLEDRQYSCFGCDSGFVAEVVDDQTLRRSSRT